MAFADARSFSGCFAYNANNDCGQCQDTCGQRTSRDAANAHHAPGRGCDVLGESNPDLAAMGAECGGAWDGPACLADGRINPSNINAAGGCTITGYQHIDGIVCCHDDYQVP